MPQRGGAVWTVGAAVESLLAMAGLDAEVTLPAEASAERLLRPIDLRWPLRRALGELLEAQGLVMRRELSREAGQVAEHRCVQPASRGALVRLAWADESRPLGEVLRIESHRPIEAAERWVARAAGWRIESTFALVPGWDPALEGLEDGAYHRGSASFAERAAVYRVWALNEDGRYTAPPFLRGPAFDLATFFGADVPGQPLRFLPCLTLDDAGVPRPPIVEVSLDGGATWSGYGGIASVREEIAAVSLDDAALPPAFLTAAKAGDARVRVTASLRSPLPVEVARWRGNPFAGAGDPRVLQVGDAFGFRRVAETSVHHHAVLAGSLRADEADDGAALSQWLAARVAAAHDAGAAGGDGRAALELAGPWLSLRPGDRLVDAGGPGIDPAGRAEAIARRGAVARRVRCRWPQGPVSLGRAGRRGGAPHTVVELSF